MSEIRFFEWDRLDVDARRRLLTRPAQQDGPRVAETVQDIFARVRNRGDAALAELTRRYDGREPVALVVSEAEIDRAPKQIGAPACAAMKQAIDNLTRFHAAQSRSRPVTVETQPGVVCRQEQRPIERVGFYVPGGAAPLPSTLLMLAVPAALAGCRERVVCSPPQADGRVAPAVLAAARLCDIRTVYAVGGAQAIAAMAFGTRTIGRVDKLFGPGNAFVTAAKMLAAQTPGGPACDLPAGPSEVLVLADDSAAADSVAADLLAQAEHGHDSQVLLFTTSPALARAVQGDIARQLAERSRAETIRAALAHAAIVLFDSVADALDASNDYAPEHLILNVRDAAARVADVRHAGSVFVGPWAAETFGDYVSGTNHVLPTYGYARAYSGVGLASFQKSITIQEISGTGFDALADSAEKLAMLEGLDAHAAAVRVRAAQRRRGAA